MSRLFFILIILIACQGYSQKIHKKNITDLKEIDSLYREFGYFDNNFIKVNYENEIIIFHHNPFRDDSRIIADSLVISLNIDSLTIVKYCQKTQIRFETLYSLLKLIIKNRFTYVGYAGPGDCYDCSIQLWLMDNKYYIVKEKNNRCLPDDCFWPELTEGKKRIRKITKEILFVKIRY